MLLSVFFKSDFLFMISLTAKGEREFIPGKWDSGYKGEIPPSVGLTHPGGASVTAQGPR
jgi:hypothetical protein